MRNTTVTKVDSAFSPTGLMGQRYLASGVRTAMRLWKDEAPGMPHSHSRRDYEVVGYVLKGRAMLEIEGQTVQLEAGDSYVVPCGALHGYTILETFSAVEATSPPAQVHSRDEHNLPSGEYLATRVTEEGHVVVTTVMDGEEHGDADADPNGALEEGDYLMVTVSGGDSLTTRFSSEGDVDLGWT